MEYVGKTEAGQPLLHRATTQEGGVLNNIVLNIPHTSINGIFDTTIGRWAHSSFFLNDCVKDWTDWYVDYLFCNDRATAVVFPYSRFVCDAERLIDDEMEKVGQGIIYTEYGIYKRGELSEEARRILLGIWQSHQDQLAQCINTSTNPTILLDCHSFPQRMSHYDICIGYNEDWSYHHKLVAMIRDEFKHSGYSVGINTPFSNSITPKANKPYLSVMIEVNKRIYLNEDILHLNPNVRQAMRWFNTIDRLYQKIQAFRFND